MTVMTQDTSARPRAAARASVRFPGKYLSVTSFRADGAGVATPVWFIEQDGRLYVDTDGASYKVRRIRGNPVVRIAPCSATGRLKASAVDARAEVVAAMPAAARADYERKYRLDRVLVLPIYRLMQLLRRKGGPERQPVVLEITPLGT